MATAKPVTEVSARPATTLITDLDNTLFDWIAIWHRSFSALLDALIELSGVPREALEADIREVHQKHRTSEYSFLIQELECLQEKHPGQDVRAIYEPAIAAHRDARTEALELYPGVLASLNAIRAVGSRVIAFTESMSFYTGYRLRKLELDGIIDILYSPPDHAPPPAGITDRYRAEHYELQVTQHRIVDDLVKPDPAVLDQIVDDVGADKATTVYVGDSLLKDVSMAQAAGILDVHAQYGAPQRRLEYELLRRVSHWSDKEIDREPTMLQGREIRPSIVLDVSFAQLLEACSFEAAR